MEEEKKLDADVEAGHTEPAVIIETEPGVKNDDDDAVSRLSSSSTVLHSNLFHPFHHYIHHRLTESNV